MNEHRCIRCAGKLYPKELNELIVCWACYARPHFQPIPAPPVIPAAVGTPPTGVAGMSGRTAPVVKSFSGSARDERCLEVWFADKVTNDTRAWLLEAINEKAMSANWRERALHAETVLAEQDTADQRRLARDAMGNKK